MAFPLQLFSYLKKAAVVTLVSLIFTGCTPANDALIAFDPNVNFKIYQTFNWHPAEVPAPKQGSGGILYSTLLDQRLKEAIASELVKKGITPEPNNPGLLVAYDITIPPSQEVSNATLYPGFGYGYSYWYGYRFRYTGDGVQNFKSIADYRTGTLVIDLIDRNTNRLVWRGWFDAELDPTMIDPDKINKAVANVMSQFPPVPNTAR